MAWGSNSVARGRVQKQGCDKVAWKGACLQWNERLVAWHFFWPVSRLKGSQLSWTRATGGTLDLEGFSGVPVLKSALGLFLRSKTMSTCHKQSNNNTKKGFQCAEPVRILELLAGTWVTQSSCNDKIVPPWCRLTEAALRKNLNPLYLPYLAYSSISKDHVELLSWWEESQLWVWWLCPSFYEGKQLHHSSYRPSCPCILPFISYLLRQTQDSVGHSSTSGSPRPMAVSYPGCVGGNRTTTSKAQFSSCCSWGMVELLVHRNLPEYDMGLSLLSPPSVFASWLLWSE